MTLSVDLAGLNFEAVDLSNLDAALHDGGAVILDAAIEHAPRESGGLAESGRVADDRGGVNTVGIEFTSVYARYQHEHLFFKHAHGGSAKFLELAMVEKADDAMQAIANRLTS